MKRIYTSQIKTEVTFQRETLLFKSANNFTNLKQVKKQLNHVLFKLMNFKKIDKKVHFKLIKNCVWMYSDQYQCSCLYSGTQIERCLYKTLDGTRIIPKPTLIISLWKGKYT